MAKCIFITGMSGTGKSTVITELAQLGYRAIDMDAKGWSEYDENREWRWHEERVTELLSTYDGVLFLSGCTEQQVKYYPQFDKIVLLSAPKDVIIQRLKTRTSNSYGKHPDELAETLVYIETVEPLLRKGADIEIDTRTPLDQVIKIILSLLET